MNETKIIVCVEKLGRAIKPVASPIHNRQTKKREVVIMTTLNLNKITPCLRIDRLGTSCLQNQVTQEQA
jgi:hypothetical protein